MVNPRLEVDSKLSVYEHNYFITHIAVTFCSYTIKLDGNIKTISDHEFPIHDVRFRYSVSNIAVVNGCKLKLSSVNLVRIEQVVLNLKRAATL